MDVAPTTILLLDDRPARAKRLQLALGRMLPRVPVQFLSNAMQAVEHLRKGRDILLMVSKDVGLELKIQATLEDLCHQAASRFWIYDGAHRAIGYTEDRAEKEVTVRSSGAHDFSLLAARILGKPLPESDWQESAVKPKSTQTPDMARLCQTKPPKPGQISLIAIGASTGGIDALVEVLSSLDINTPPILIVQHTRNSDGASLIHVLNKASRLEVVPASHNAPLFPGRAYLMCGDQEHLTIGGSQKRTQKLVASDPVSGHRPSVDVTFRSVAEHGDSVLGVLLTGMGKDGAAGLKEIKDAGGWTIGQDEASSVVYGMPRAAFDIGGVCEQLPLSAVGPRIQLLTRARP